MSDNEQWIKQETYKSLIQLALSAGRFTFFANGGSVIAILAFLSAVWKDGQKPDMSSALICFLTGVFLSGCAHLTAYLSQHALYEEDKQKHNCLRYFTLLLIMFSLISFGVGSWLGTNALSL